MASMGIRTSLLHQPSFFTPNQNQNFPSNPFLPISNKTKKPQKHRVSSSNSSTLVSHPGKNAKDSISVEKIDSWMQESVSEIVKNLKRAPLLVQVYSENEGGKKKAKIQTERAILGNWAAMKGKWGNGGSRSPDGLIFVEELGQEGSCPDQEFGEGVSKAWGVVIQGQGADCRPACYLLKTSRVYAGMGLGSCTHFCLMRVENFRDGALEQFKDSWLLT